MERLGLATTLCDQHGVLLPILDTKGYGQGLTTLLIYLMAPFVGLLGPSTFAIRLPGAIGGVATVAMVYFIGRRLFDRRVGLIAAAILAVLPWHLQLSRWGHMVTLFPLCVAAVILLMLRADNWKRAAVAGAVAGLSMYGYYAIRLWMPLFLIATAFFWWRRWRELGAFIAGGTVVAGPLVFGTLFTPLLMKRASLTWVWDPGDPMPTRVAKAAARYLPHFGLDFLFRRGDIDPTDSPPTGHGFLFWFMLPLLVAGAAFLIARWRTPSASSVAVPACHVPRRRPAEPPPDLARDAQRAGDHRVDAPGRDRRDRDLRRRAEVQGPDRDRTRVWASIETVRSLPDYFSEFQTNPRKWDAYTVDLHEALRWVRPRAATYDAILITGTATAHPYVRTLIELRVPPRTWLAGRAAR